MNRKEFSKILNGRIRTCKNILEHKADVYAAGSDRLSNFKDAGRLLSCTPERALQGFMTKHIVALNDFIAQLDNNIVSPLAEWEEKIGDIINYLILLEALVKEKHPEINFSCGRTPAAGPAPTKKSPKKTLQSPDSPAGNSLVTTVLTGDPELPGMSQEVPGARSGKHWKDAIEPPAAGTKVRITDIGINDGFYKDRSEFIGLEGVVVHVAFDDSTGWFYGELMIEGKGGIVFAEVKLQIQV